MTAQLDRNAARSTNRWFASLSEYALLVDVFNRTSTCYPPPETTTSLAFQLGLSKEQIINWFSRNLAERGVAKATMHMSKMRKVEAPRSPVTAWVSQMQEYLSSEEIERCLQMGSAALPNHKISETSFGSPGFVNHKRFLELKTFFVS